MVNLAVLVGVVNRSPEIRFGDGGNPTLRLGMYTLKKIRDGREFKSYHNVIMFGYKDTAARIEELAASIGQGDVVCVMGSTQTRNYDQGGEKKSITEVVATDISVVMGSGVVVDGGGSGGVAGAGSPGSSSPDDDGDSIPF